MKRILKIIYAGIIILMIPFSVVRGQDKKSEQKIRIVVDDGSGTKVVIDTIIYDSPKPDSIMLKDGSVIYLKHPGNEKEFKHHDGKSHILVTASEDSSSISHEGRGGHKYKVITRNSDGQSEKEEIIYINKGKKPDKEIESTIDVYVSDDNNESTIEKSKYVIAKDGMVVTVEGNDDARAKELVKVIESNLGVTGEETGKKETVKVESKKIIKK